MFFVVNCFDHYFTTLPEENNPDEGHVKHLITSEFDVELEDVYPVCGQWAFYAHLCKTDPSRNTAARHAINMACMNYKQKKPLLVLAGDKSDVVIGISGFECLERRY